MQPKNPQTDSAGNDRDQFADEQGAIESEDSAAGADTKETILWDGPMPDSATDERLLRLQADMQNLRNRTAREIADERRYAPLPIIRGLLPVLDNIDRAIEAAEKAGEAENLLSGFRLVRQQLMTTLTQHHCEPISPVGEEFDPHFHEAILQQPSPEVPAGNVIMVTQTGYKLHDRVIRPAQVIVSSGAPKD